MEAIMSRTRINLKYFFSNILNAVGAGVVIASVSYTHLTLPTIYSV